MPPSNKRVLNDQELRQLRAGQRVVRSASAPARPKPKIDIRQTKEYKSLYRKWVSTIVALPILFYTSWELYQRVYGAKAQKHLIDKTKRSE